MVDSPIRSQMHKVLIVDDEPSFQKLMKTQLEYKNYDVVNCLKSEEAVKLIEENSPHLVLMDIMMPKMDGFSLIKRIRELELHYFLPIVVVTARDNAQELAHAMDLGADDYITKPFEFEELLARIKNMLRIKKLQDSLLNKTEEINQANLKINHLNEVLSQTNKELKKKVYDLHNIFEISFKVMGHTEKDKLINTALLNALGIFTARSVMLMLLESDDRKNFVVKESRGFLGEKVDEFTIPRDDKLVKYLEFIKKPLILKDVSYEFENVMPTLEEFEIKALAPLFQEEDLIGILCLGPSVSRQDYQLDILEILGILTNMLSVALHNSQSFEQIKALSYTDEMTGLHNYRFFIMRLKEEIARAKRNDSPLALLILDVDFFKNYNDALGHPAGDEILRQLSDILKAIVRDNDIVARYGGEEFAMILPSTDKKGAGILANRLRKKIEKYKFPHQEIQPNGTLTISIGIALYPENAIDRDDVVVAADRALYYAKERGRNRVVHFEEIKA